MSNWVTSLDNLASSGVIDFDAPAFILGQNPRYVGNPAMDSIPLENPQYQPHGVKMKDIPSIDSYDKDSDDKNMVHNPGWKKLLFGVVAIGSAAIIAYNILTKKGKIPKIQNINWSNVKTKVIDIGENILSYIKKTVSYIKSKIYQP